MGEVSKIFLCEIRKKPRVEITQGLFLENYGLNGDVYSESGVEKQVTVFFDEARDSLALEPYEGLCFKRFLETIRIKDLKAEDLKTGTKITLGETVFQVTGVRKKCYSECKIIKDNRHCALSTDVRFCKVLKTGIVRKGDSVKIIT
jgi:MOSC domain-containing protein YiiM